MCVYRLQIFKMAVSENSFFLFWGVCSNFLHQWYYVGLWQVHENIISDRCTTVVAGSMLIMANLCYSLGYVILQHTVGFEVLTAVSEFALMMEARRTSETLVNFYQTTRLYNPEDSHLLQHTVLLSGPSMRGLSRTAHATMTTELQTTAIANTDSRVGLHR
jgi:hypothetical protein